METFTYCETEKKQLEKIEKIQLHPRFFKIGGILFGMAFIMMVVYNIILDGDNQIIKEVLRYGMLISLLVVSIAKDQKEDELTLKLRSQSYSIAFVLGVAYAIIMPFVEYGVAYAMSSSSESLEALSGFQILIFMLIVQIMIYIKLKKIR
ncbi:MAG: hypothetical protein V3V00_10785 [Saprospiraceae bacterium]